MAYLKAYKASDVRAPSLNHYENENMTRALLHQTLLPGKAYYQLLSLLLHSLKIKTECDLGNTEILWRFVTISLLLLLCTATRL